MFSDRVRPFKWKPFDLYNDICVERYRKINSPPVTAAKPKATVAGNCCDSVECNRNHKHRPSAAADKIDRKSFLIRACSIDDQCELINSSTNCPPNRWRACDTFTDECHVDDVDDATGLTAAVDADINKYKLSSRSQFFAPPVGSTGSSCASSTASSLSPNIVNNSNETSVNPNKVEQKNDVRTNRRSLDDAPPIVYGPLPYSKSILYAT